MLLLLQLCFFSSCFVFGLSKKHHHHPHHLRSQDDGPIVTIPNGKILGKYWKTYDQKTDYASFRGIPYAQPPIGNLRFQAPQPVQNWNGTLNGTLDRSMCVQNNDTVVIGSEDCLFVNVYSPKLINVSSLLPVMVWIYGGSFATGDGSYKTYNPELFINEHVVYVSLNYRLGIFGYLSTNDKIAPGNFGLKDQLLALKWVKNNIKFFGGNPNNITIFGESAGGASVSFLSQIPASRGLFNAVIAQSGVTLCSWSLARNVRDIVRSIAEVLFINTLSSESMINGLRKVNSKHLQEVANAVGLAVNIQVSAGKKKIIINPLTGLVFAPVIEPNVEGALVTNRSHQMLSDGDFHRIPHMIGFNSFEGAIVLPVLEALRFYLSTYDVAPVRLVPEDLNLKKEDQSPVAQIIKNYYFGSNLIFASTIQFAKYASDRFFVNPIHQTVLQISKYSPVYYYLFAYNGALGNPDRQVPGVGHAEDLNYIFKNEPAGTVVNSTDELTRRRLVKMWTNFAKYGNPTPNARDELLQNVVWPVASTDQNLAYLNIDKTLTIASDPRRRDMLFWKFLYENYGNPPFDTY